MADVSSGFSARARGRQSTDIVGLNAMQQCRSSLKSVGVACISLFRVGGELGSFVFSLGVSLEVFG